ncbi:FAD NAD-binding domain-containing protein [Mycena venus]|uniref:FAD NAD-binding domain-containing protein n=1 Tax=Mycena venus TaxID=2733690 RepID=A0A8H6X2X9_9AGAR|nr:FAD NAD-binding domain-containing protein [Mycena venus]
MSDTKSEYKFRVVIAGCGIGGLALAAFISRFTKENSDGRITVDIYEAKPEVSTIGAGVAIWKRSWQVLQDLGFEAEFIKKGFKVPKDGECNSESLRVTILKAYSVCFDQPVAQFFASPTNRLKVTISTAMSVPLIFHYALLSLQIDGPVGLHRPTLLEIFESKLSADCKIHTSKRLERYEVSNNGSVNVVFSDDSVVAADILVGADGIHSATRGTMFKSIGQRDERYLRPTFTGTIAYRSGIPKDKFVAAFPNHSAAEKAQVHIVSQPLGPWIDITCYNSEPELEGKLYDGPMVKEVATKDVVGLCEDWEPDLLSLIKSVESYNAWAIHVVNPLPRYVSGVVVLIGDAAHAMTPYQGIGGGQAIEDAHILGRILSHTLTRKDNISSILKLYEALRLSPTQEAAKKSRNNGLLYQFNHPDFPFSDPNHPQRDELEAIGNAIGRSFGWLADGDAEADWVEAEAKLKEIADH